MGMWWSCGRVGGRPLGWVKIVAYDLSMEEIWEGKVVEGYLEHLYWKCMIEIQDHHMVGKEKVEEGNRICLQKVANIFVRGW